MNNLPPPPPISITGLRGADITLDELLALPDQKEVTHGDAPGTAQGLLDAVLQHPMGMEVDCGDELTSKRLQHAIHTARRADRKANLKAGGVETSDYDNIVVSRIGSFLQLTLHFKFKIRYL